jgi:hypothetical protein
MKRILALALVFAAMPAMAQQLYRCGNTYSQTPCGADAKEVKVMVPPACQDESTRYTSACLDERFKELRSPAAPSKADREAQTKLEAAKRLPPPSEAIVSANLKACEASIRNSMKDPDAAKISEGRRLGPTLDYVKGAMVTRPAVSYSFKVNGKNSYGAYTGAKLWSCMMSLDEKDILDVKELAPYPG